jgi:hypothetical protein
MAAREEYDAVVHDAAASDGALVTPSDSTVMFRHTRGLYIGSAGDLVVRMVAGTSLTFASLPAGALLPLRVDMVKATGTTAGNIVALF